MQCPKYARWHVNRKDIYTTIQDELYGHMNMRTIGQEVEELFLSQYDNYTTIDDPFDVDTTKQAIERGDSVIYQPVFKLDNLYVRWDLLVKNSSWRYDLIEIKSKTSIRGKSDKSMLYQDLLYDLSFQSYVVSHFLGNRFSGNVNLVYINKSFVKNGEVLVDDFFVQEYCREELLSSAVMRSLLYTLAHTLVLDEQSFDDLYPYDGENPLLYFGRVTQKDSIFAIPWWYKIKPFITQWVAAHKYLVSDINEKDLLELTAYNWSWKNIAQSIKTIQEDEIAIDTHAIDKELSSLAYPLCFYDYETVATAIPLFDGYHPWQQIVVQYSMHIVHEDGHIDHKQSIIYPWTDTNKSVIDDFVRDIGDGYGTYIVWNKSFENGRNDDIALLYPEYAHIFLAINELTFDLMDIFKNGLYFHPDFLGSASIKKVLPVLTDISYDNLSVSHGGAATSLLQQLIVWSIASNEVDDSIAMLREYCSQDTWAMVRIWEEIRA